MSGLIEAFTNAADVQADVIESGRPRAAPVEMKYGRVLQAGDDGTLTLSIDGDETPYVRMTTACRGVAEGDTVLVTKFGAKLVATGVLARDNRHYVKEGCKVLYSNPSGMYMSERQTANLSEPLSAQGKGIVLHWQGYTPGTGVHDYQHNFIFVPKTFNRGVGLGMLLMADSRLVAKYVYVKDDSLKGHANNASQDTISGVSIDNRYQVLTEVLGV